MLVLGISGPSGAGKDISSDFLAKKLSMDHVSGGDVLRSMLKSLGLDFDKHKLLEFGIFIRKNYGAEVVYNGVLTLSKNRNGIIWSGFRSPSEAKIIKDRGGQIIYIDAPMDVLHSRVQDRKRDGDNFEKDKFIRHENHSDEFETGENLVRVKQMSDFIVNNDGTLEELYSKLEDIVEELTKTDAKTTINL